MSRIVKQIFSKRNLLVATHIGALFPILWLAWDFYTQNLSVNPIQDLTLRTGKPAFVILLLSLCVTPLNIVTGWREIIPTRKWLGLYAFGYAAIHFLIFIGLDYGFNWSLIYNAVFEKAYALVGFAAFLILLPLALTSSKGWMRRLGRGWKKLHSWVYLAGILAVFHYIWLVKSDIREPVAWGIFLAFLLILRIPPVRRWVVTQRNRRQKRVGTPKGQTAVPTLSDRTAR